MDPKVSAHTISWFGYPFVQKTRRGGYDGKGVQVIKGPGTTASCGRCLR